MSNNSQQRRVLILAGGTGGHIFPALEVAKKLIEKNCYVHWLGTKKGLESEIIPKNSIPIDYIAVSGLRGKRAYKLFTAPIMLLISFLQAIYFILKIKPDVVLGMGGFVSGPSGLAAFCLRKKLIIHEQNSIAGTTNKILSYFSNKVFFAFPNTFNSKRNKYELIGNPVRGELSLLNSADTRINIDEDLKMLILGGSRGARAINECIPKTLALFRDNNLSIPRVWHQAGAKLFAETKDSYAGLNITPFKLAPFIDNMAEAYSWADVVVCRAGALTVSELSAVGLGGILIPFPYAIDDHQTKNAEFLCSRNAAVLLVQKNMTPEKLFSSLLDFSKDKNKLITMAKNSYNAQSSNAAERIVNYCFEG